MITETSFKCQLCETTISFHIEDSSTYLAKTDELKFAGMELATYRIGHEHDELYHVNVVTVDHRGHWRGHKDAYKEDVPKVKKELHLLNSNNIDRYKSQIFEFLILVDSLENWVFEVLSPDNIMPLSIAETVLETLSEIDDDLIEEGLRTNMELFLVDQNFKVSIFGARSIVYITKSLEKESVHQMIFDQLFFFDFDKNSEEDHQLLFMTILELFDFLDVSEIDNKKIGELVDMAYLSNPLQTSNNDVVSDLITKLVNQKSFPEHLVMGAISLLSGQVTLLELIHQGFFDDFNSLMDIVEFLKIKIKD
ncbi:MAG: hypothetical protein IH840_17060 [Candidatus Heimdallarchaeota archaeon]|nr:hypothetical protein [Candidatus Heimdallarchaeota archaeon]